MQLILLGAPGAGKGTQADVLSEQLRIPHISTGDMFRANIKNGTDLGKIAKEYMDRGALVPDELTFGIIKDRLLEEDCKDGFILDGFPRTIPQAVHLDETLSGIGVAVDYAIDISVPDSIILNRITGRRLCSQCKASYHVNNNPPKSEGKCDACSSNLIQRSDDYMETVEKRLKAYHDQTEPLIEFYTAQGKLHSVDGTRKVAEITSSIYEILGLNK